MLLKYKKENGPIRNINGVTLLAVNAANTIDFPNSPLYWANKKADVVIKKPDK